MEGRGDGWWPEEEGPRADREPSERSDDADGADQGDDADASGRDAPRTPGGGPADPSARRPPQRRPPRGLESRDRPKVASRYSLYVGLAFVAIAVVAVLNAFNTDDDGILGAGTESGLALRQFAVPDVRGPLSGDANIADDDCESSRNPCPSDQVRTPACEIQTKGAIRVCDLFDKPVAFSFWFTRGGNCLPTQDNFDRVARKFEGEVNFLSINVLDDRDAVQKIVRERGWTVPVGHDADGAVSNIYRVGICPTIVFGYPGGILQAAEIEPGFSQAQIEELVQKLLDDSRRRERLG